MATTKSCLNANLPSTVDLNSDDSPWLSSYRALCSKDEDDHWEIFLSAKPTTVFAAMPQNLAATIASSVQSSRDTINGPIRKGLSDNRRQHHSSTSVTSDDAFSTSLSIESLLSLAITGNSDGFDEIYLEPENLGSRWSQAICNIGFSCIDYFTRMTDEPMTEKSLVQNVCNVHRCKPVITPMALEPDEAKPNTEDDPIADWTAALSGRRTATVERRRALSRTVSQESGISDHWYGAMDRLSRWDDAA
ncbi:hypothetical protein BGZ99_009504 [Dissophora globulifera]|uniref:Uncharacterized protein n=1 Tax=Dissophora globulifera TaxID=979702 RepID=A0A9P6RSE6_9FUNG|nr:hypothetical protein BGZ99_009504 [Dissophora globulifera]